MIGLEQPAGEAPSSAHEVFVAPVVVKAMVALVLFVVPWGALVIVTLSEPEEPACA